MSSIKIFIKQVVYTLPVLLHPFKSILRAGPSGLESNGMILMYRANTGSGKRLVTGVPWSKFPLNTLKNNNYLINCCSYFIFI